jgi:midasin
MVTLHLDHAADSKSLLGAYVCGDTPGEFRWQPGALAQAVVQGRWVLLEDVDAAPSEVVTALVPLMEGRPLPVPGRGEALTPAPGFMLFGSVTTRPGIHRALACPGLWTRVHVAPPPEGEVGAILAGVLTHPGGQHLVQPLLSSLAAARALCGQAGGAPGGRAAVSLGGRELTLRDLIKWGQRMRSLHAAASHPLPDDTLAVQARELAVLEGADLLAGMVPPGPGRDVILARLADAWGVSPDRALHYDSLHRPATSTADGQLRIGRVSLQVHRAAPPPLTSSGGYALTSHACRQLERLAAAVGCCEPVLLVGETGAGKTAAVQALARSVGARLTVVNMSTQSDSADLLGGFKPQDPSALCLPLATRFSELFGQTFPKEANAEFAARVVRLPRSALGSRPHHVEQSCGATVPGCRLVSWGRTAHA